MQIKKFIQGKFLKKKLSFTSSALYLCIIILTAGYFGFIVGTYTGGIQLLYSSIKIPLLMLITAVITLPFMLVAGLIAQQKVSLAQILHRVLYGLAQTGLLMAALSPFMWLIVQSGDYRISILGLSAIFIISGGYSIYRQNKVIGLNGAGEIKNRILIMTIAWAIIYTFVAGQVWWLMRPWIGYTYKEKDVPFVRTLDEKEITNVYESIELTGRTWILRQQQSKEY